MLSTTCGKNLTFLRGAQMVLFGIVYQMRNHSRFSGIAMVPSMEATLVVKGRLLRSYRVVFIGQLSSKTLGNL